MCVRVFVVGVREGQIPLVGSACLVLTVSADRDKMPDTLSRTDVGDDKPSLFTTMGLCEWVQSAD